MRVLNLSLDSSLLDKSSISAQRMIEYGELTEKYNVIVPSREKKILDLSDKTRAYGSGGNNRVSRLLKIYNLARIIIRQEKCDCITTQDPFEVGFIGLLLAEKFKVALNVQEHGDFFSQKYWRQEKLLHLCRYYLGLFVIKRADSVRVVSRRIKDYLISNLKISPDKIITVPVFMFVKTERQARLEKKENFVFLNLGRFVKQKNLLLLLKAFSQVLKKHPDARLLLIGRGPEEKKLKNICSRLNIASAVRFLDWTDNVDAYYAQADAYVLSSNYEGWGRVIIEATAAGLPIIMTDVGCAGEAVVNEESALISPVGDTEKFARNMLRVMEDKELAKRLADNAFIALKNLPNKQESMILYKSSWTAIDKKQ